MIDLATLPTPKDARSVASLPASVTLAQNYPNPFNPSTTITFTLPADGNVLLRMYDALGRVVATLVDGRLEAGTHDRTFDAHGLTSGAYLCRLEADGRVLTRMMQLVK